MTEPETQQPASTPKAKTAKTAKPAKLAKPKTAKPRQGPTYREMVTAAIKNLNERKGSSRQAILKYIKANYTVTAPEVHLKLALKSMIKGGALLQVKGVGASGSFKLNDGEAKPARTAKKVTKTGTPKKAGKPAAAKKSVKAKSTSKKTADPKKTPKKKPATKVTPKKTATPKTKKPVAKKSATPKKSPAKKVVKKTVKKVAAKTKKAAAKK